MGLDRSKGLAVAERRRLVADLCVRGVNKRHSTREIAALLAQQDKVNPINGKAWSHQTIASDIKAVEKQWQKESVRDIANHKAEVLAQYQELLRIHWQADAFDKVRLVLSDLRSLMGTDTVQVKLYEQMTEQMDELLDVLALELGREDYERVLHRLAGSSANGGTVSLTN